MPDQFGNVDEMVIIDFIIKFYNFLSLSQHHRNIIELNCQSMIQMTHLVLPKMVEK